MRFDVFCDIVDNYGDAGYSWRLARRLAQPSPAHRHDFIRLFCHDLNLLNLLSAGDLKSICENLHIEVLTWSDANDIEILPDIVIETFGCKLPQTYLNKVNQGSNALIINLEYLSAEPWVESHHGLPSSDPQTPNLKKYFFFPGFSKNTGTLLKGVLPYLEQEPPLSLIAAWSISAEKAVTHRFSLFCYETTELLAFLEQLDKQTIDTDIFVCFGQAQELVSKYLKQAFTIGDVVCHKNIRFIALPFVSQNDYDWLLLHCDLNIVRGEDSFVRAQWAGKPFIWHIYPQSDGAHLLKLDAFLNQYLQGAKPSVKKAVNLAMHWQSPKEWLLDLKSIDEHANVWRDRLFELTKDGDLAQSLRTFISEKC